MRVDVENDGKIKSIELAFQIAKSAAQTFGHVADCYPNLNSAEFRESDLLREGAWVILCTGFRERVVRRIFCNFSICFCNWISAEAIIEKKEICRKTALDVFRNERKINGIIDLVENVHFESFEKIHAQIMLDPVTRLRELNYVGPVTAFHLAKNLGFQVAKPDRHLQRISEIGGFNNPHEMCSILADITREPISVVDGVLWRLVERGLVDQFDIFRLIISLRQLAHRAL